MTLAEEPLLLREACRALPDWPPPTIDQVAAPPQAASKLLDQLGIEVKFSATVIFDGFTVNVTAMVCGLLLAFGSLMVIVALYVPADRPLVEYVTVIVSGGQSGNCLQAVRSSAGSSAKAKVYNITASSSYTISVYIKCPSGSSYWAECAYKLGSYTAQNFDADSGSWTMIKKFASDGTNGNGNVWTQYSKTFNSGSNTQISVGYKLGSSSGTGPTLRWDTLRIQ